MHVIIIIFKIMYDRDGEWIFANLVVKVFHAALEVMASKKSIVDLQEWGRGRGGEKDGEG